MLWPFNRFLTPRTPLRGTIETIYGMIVAQAREPLLYQDLGVPDTVDGRFDMVVLHLWMVLRQMKRPGHNGRLGQALFDHFCSDMDHNLRELGTGDLAVPRRMQQFGEAFYGRSAAYDQAQATGAGPLAQALRKNIYNGLDNGNAPRLAAYVEQALAVLAATDESAISSACWQFPSPAPIMAVPG
jgi:cytochrome b pre-mRNA-processing protein 3